jgi:hypothetical protein
MFYEMVKKKKKEEITDEMRVAQELAEAAYEVALGGKKFLFRPVTLNDRYSMAAAVADIRLDIDENMNDAEMIEQTLIAGKHAGNVARFISFGASVRGYAPIAWIRRRRIFNAAYYRASEDELMNAIRCILSHLNPSFFLSISISLNRQNTLKKTKETKATVPG